MAKTAAGTAPVIYEVRLAVDPDIRRDFDRWLDGHVRAMIALPGFYDARVIRAEPGQDGRIRRLVRYRLRDRAALDDYLKSRAEAMRRDGVERFGDRFSAERDIYPAKTGDEDGEHRCPNCGAAANHAFCPSCGQEQKDIHVSFPRLLLDFLGDTFTFDSRLARSLRPLIARPGFLTREYFLGRRARYIPPLRLYLFISIVFFGLLSFMLSGADFVRMNGETGAPAGQQQTATEAGKQDGGDEPNVDVNLFGHGLSPEIENHLERQARKVNESPALFARFLLENLPVMMFLLLPVYSLILRLLYPLAGFVYLEHLIFSLHVHAFTFLVLLFLMITNFAADRLAPTATLWPFHTAISLYWMAYPWMAMRTAYRQGIAMTTLKYVLQSVIYVVLLGASITTVSVAALYWF